MELAARKQEIVVKSRPDFVISTYALGASFLLLAAADGKYGMNTDCDFYKLDYATLAVTPYAVYGEAIGSSVGCDVRHGGGQAFKMDGDVLLLHLDALRRRGALQARRRHRLPRPRARRQRRLL